MMTPEVLEREPLFESGVEALSDEGTPVSAVIDLARHPDGWAASMALVALERRDDVPDEWVDAAIRALPRPSNCEDAFQLRAIARHADGRAIGRILGRTEGIYPGYVVDFVTARVEAGEHIDVDTFRGNVTAGQADELESYLDRIGGEMGDEVRAAFKEWRTLELFGSIGRVWQRPFDRPQALLAGRRSDVVDLVVAALTAAPPRSVILVGEHGAGKTALARAALDRIQDVTVFEATASQVIAGQVYVGELDGRVKQLADGMRGRSTIWVMPELQEALFAGQHTRSPHGLLDALLPHVESGSMTLLAEVTPTALDVLRASPSAGHVGVRRHPRPLARPGRLDRGRPPRARARRPRRDDGRRDAHAGIRLRPAVPPGLRTAGRAPPSRQRDRAGGARAQRGGVRRWRRPRDPRGGVGAAARDARRRRSPPPRGRPGVLRGAHPAAARRGDLCRRADRDGQGGPDRSEAGPSASSSSSARPARARRRSPRRWRSSSSGRRIGSSGST